LELEQIPGVGKSIAKRLKEAGFANAETLAITTARELKEKAKYEKLEAAQRIVEAAREALGCRFMTALEYWELEKKKLRCTTGSKALDGVLGGGIETRAITEFGGKFGSGKTQICLMLCVTAQLKPEEGGFGGRVLFFDTEGTFSSRRVYQIAAENGLDPGQALNNIILSRVYTSDHQMFLLEMLLTNVRRKTLNLSWLTRLYLILEGISLEGRCCLTSSRSSIFTCINFYA
jgi:DNA repair protein RadA